jgi:hypothetical protein
VAGTLAGLALLAEPDRWTAAALGGSGIIAVFVAGTVFGVVARGHAEEVTFLAEQTGELLNAVTWPSGASASPPTQAVADREPERTCPCPQPPGSGPTG